MPPRRTPEDNQTEGPPYEAKTEIASRRKTHLQSSGVPRAFATRATCSSAEGADGRRRHRLRLRVESTNIRPELLRRYTRTMGDVPPRRTPEDNQTEGPPIAAALAAELADHIARSARERPHLELKDSHPGRLAASDGLPKTRKTERAVNGTA